MDIDWVEGSHTVRWGQGTVQKTFARPPASVVAVENPPSVLVVEAIEGSESQPGNAIVFNEDGTERLRLIPPALPEVSWHIGYYMAYIDAAGKLVAVYSTRVGDRWGRPDLSSGELHDVREWR